MSALIGDFHASIGVARADITPPLTARWKLWGAATDTTASGVHRPLTATALAIISGDQRLLIVSLDVCEWTDPAAEHQVRESIQQACGVGPDQLLLHSTHTHSAQAPCPVAAIPAERGLADDHLELIRLRTTEAALAALADAGEAVLSWGLGRSSLAVNRDQLLDGRPVVGYDPDLEADSTVMVGRVSDTTGVRAILVSYACHPTVLGWGNRLISPDYVGALRAVVEEQYPQAIVCFLQGASGELAPARQYRADAADADRAGRSLAHSVLAALELMPPADHRLAFERVVESGAPLGVWTEQPVAPRRDILVERIDLRLPRRAEATIVGTDLPAHVMAERQARAALVAQASAGAEDVLDYPVWLWQLGEAVIVAHPGEAYSWLASTLRAALSPRPVLVANLTNGAGAFYLPDRASYARGGYTVNQTPAGSGSLETLAETVLAHLGAPTQTNNPTPTRS